MFKLKNIPKERELNINKLKDKLDNLKNKIPQIIDLQTGVNISTSSNAYDLVLVTLFKDQQELEDYKIHPEHLLVLDYLKEVNETMTVVDYTLD